MTDDIKKTSFQTRKLYEKIFLGNTILNKTQVMKVVEEMGPEFTAEKYNLVTRNCYTFVDLICMKLLNIELPMKYKNLFMRIVGQFMTDNGITMDLNTIMTTLMFMF